MKNLTKIGCIGLFLSAFICCMPPESKLIDETDKSVINTAGENIYSRFNTPIGFERSAVQQNSFAEYLRNLPLKAAGTKVRYYDGSIKHKAVYAPSIIRTYNNVPMPLYVCELNTFMRKRPTIRFLLHLPMVFAPIIRNGCKETE